MQDFSGKTAVITGSASGIGLATARRLGALGMNIVLSDVDANALAQAEQSFKDQGVPVLAVVTDVGSSASVQALKEAAYARFGSVQVLMNNAGVYTGGFLWEQSEQDFEWMLRVNVWGVIHGIQQFVPAMMAQGDECHIINVGSVAGLTCMPFTGIYHMTKHAVVALSESLHHDLSLAAPSIKVSLLCPPPVNTAIAAAERNRPAALRGEDRSPSRQIAVEALVQSTAEAMPAEVIAEQIEQGLRDQQFYLLPDAGNPWWKAIRARAEAIEARRNPVFEPL